VRSRVDRMHGLGLTGDSSRANKLARSQALSRPTGSCLSVHGSRYAAIGPLGSMMTRALLRINLQTIRRAVVTVSDRQFEGPRNPNRPPYFPLLLGECMVF
jgi:hypothetical protein